MKPKQIFIAAAAALAAYLVARAFMGRRRSTAPASTIANDALPGQPGWGWQYFDDGTAISPEGVYFYQGNEVWRPQ